MVGGPWGATIGVGLGHLVDSAEQDSERREPQRPVVEDGLALVQRVEVRCGRFEEIRSDLDVIWARLWMIPERPGAIAVAMQLEADGVPVRSLSPHFSDEDGYVVVVSEQPTLADGTRLIYDLVLPVAVADLPSKMNKLEALLLAANSQEVFYATKIAVPVDVGKTQQKVEEGLLHLITVLWGAVVADGRVDEAELAKMRLLMTTTVGIPPEQVSSLEQHLRSLRMSRDEFVECAAGIADRLGPDLKRNLVAMMVELVAADGELTKEEHAYVLEVGKVFGLSEDEIERAYEASREGRRVWALMVLGLPRHATMEEITKRFRELALKYHPDRLVDFDEDFRRLGAAKFRRIKHAYDLLREN